MTCNQLMIILDAYRGTLDSTRHMANYESDLQHLSDHGWLLPNLNLTPLARLYVKELLRCLPDTKSMRRHPDE